MMLYQDRSLTTEARTDDLLARMTLEQQLGQLVQADGRVDAAEQVRHERAGSFLHILGTETVELQRLAEATGFGIPLLFGIDAIHGHGFWPGATVFPTQLALSCAWNPELAESMGRITAREMLCTGLHWTFSPVLCITRDLRWGRVGETFGEDAYLIGELGKALIHGLQGARLSDPESVMACAKHFAGYSETVGGRDATEAELSERKLRSLFFPPFREAVRAGCRTFMTAYQCIDGVSCVVNRWLLSEVLRDEWGFDGFVVTDWDNVGRTYKQQAIYPSIEAAVPDSLRAGNDLIMVTPEFYDAALHHVRTGGLDAADIERSCRRVLRQKFELGLFDDKRYPELDRVPEIVGCNKHRVEMLECARQCLVLLKNDQVGSRALLPLNAESVKRIAVLGPNADDHIAQLGDWSFGSGQAQLSTDGHPRHLVKTVLDGVRERAKGVAVDFAPGCRIMDPDTSEVGHAAALARSADVAVVVVGDVLEETGEECDRSDLELSGGQLPLLQAVKATGTPLVVVLVNSKPLCLSWVAQHADAIVEAFNPGMLGGQAIAELLFGDFNPQGKLTTSFPRTLGQQPVTYQQAPGWHGNKHGTYDTSPLFPFGFGLSYTRFAYANFHLSNPVLRTGQAVSGSFEVSNVGTRAGVEITQLYINDMFSSLSTPSKLLKHFARVSLQPGESKLVSFELPYEELGFFDRTGALVVEPGVFEAMVGPSSQDDTLLRARFEVVA